MAVESFQSSNFTVQFDNAVFTAAQVGEVRSKAQALPAACEVDYANMCRWYGLAVGDGFGPANRVTITITTKATGGENFGYSTANPPMNLNPRFSEPLDTVVGLFANEMIEILMSWKNPMRAGFSGGEGLSRVVGELLHPNTVPATVQNYVNAWLASDPTKDPSATLAGTEFRKDWISVNFEGGKNKTGNFVNGDDDSYSYGCAMLFNYFLMFQLGFSMSQIVRNLQATWAGTYTALTGDASGGFDRFKQLLAKAFPAPTKGLLAGDNPFPVYLEHLATPLTLSDAGSGDVKVAYQDLDSDLFYVKRQNSGTGQIEIHSLTRQSNYQAFNLHKVTALNQADAVNGDFLLAASGRRGVPDLYFVKRRNTGASGHIELHVLSGSSDYQAFTIQRAMPILISDAINGDFALADFDGDGVPDLVFIKRRSTASSKIEVHVLGSSSKYQAFVVQTATALNQAEDANGDFLIGAFDAGQGPDLFFVKRRTTGSRMVEVHVLSGASGFKSFAIHLPTLVFQGDEGNGGFALCDFDQDGRQELLFVKHQNVASGRMEMHVAPIPRSVDTF